MIGDTNFLQSELRRLEENLLSYSGERQWQIVTVTFPSTERDVDVAHNLTATDPYFINVQVLQSSAPILIYRGLAPWGAGLITLRGTTPGAQAVLLLTVTDDADTRVIPVGATDEGTTGGGSYPLFGYHGASLGSVGDQNALLDSFLGPGVDFATELLGSTAHWQLGLKVNGSDSQLAMRDVKADLVPFMFRRFGGNYYLQPGPQSKSSTNSALGNPNDSARTGYWTALYVDKIYSNSSTVAEGEWTTYTPTWKSSIASVTVGNGSITGSYAVIGKTVKFRIVMGYGSTTSDPNPGSAWTFGLPVAPKAGLVGPVGTAYSENAGVASYASWQALVNAANAEVACYSPGTSAGASTIMSNANPFAFGSGDFVVIEGSYEKA